MASTLIWREDGSEGEKLNDVAEKKKQNCVLDFPLSYEIIALQ